jgi:hypothetical protein
VRTSIAGKIENTALPVSRPLAPLYEAIHNAFQAIEEGGGKGHSITIEIERLSDMLHEGVARPISFTITDTGIGFNDENAKSFFTAESRHKADRGGKGNGRFLWLKAFNKVNVDSNFRAQDGSTQKRKFVFDRREEQDVPRPVPSSAKRTGTTMTLTGLDDKLSKQLSRPLEWFADRIIAHFLPYFRRSDYPAIEIGDGRQKLSLNERFTETVSPNAVPRTFQVEEQSFTLTGYRITSAEARDNMLVFAARGRAVKRERLARYEKGLERKLDNGDGTTSAYLGFVEGVGLDMMVRTDRFGFEIDEDEDDLIDETKSLSSIRAGALTAVREDLAPFLGRLREQKEDAVSRYVTQQAPEYRRLLKTRKSQVLEGLPPNPRPKEIEAALGRVWVEQQVNLKEEGKAILAFETGSDTLEQYQKQMEGFLDKFEELNQTTLAQHVIHRRIVLNLLDKALQRDDDTGRYQLEAVVHRLVHPMRKSSDEIEFEEQNLWILDDRLTYHESMESDKELRASERIESTSATRPDILVVFNRTLAFREGRDPTTSFVVVEFKRPDRKNFERAPLSQVFDVVREIREGTFKDGKGRPVEGASRDAPAFCYVVCDINKQVERGAVDAGGQLTPDGRGYFGYNGQLKLYFEVISYEKLIGDALRRNRILFKKLGLPTDRLSDD